jgi:CRP-like cAMP-binding protein
MDNLFSALGNHVTVNSMMKLALLKMIHLESFRKRTTIITEGNAVNHLFFVEKGIIRKSKIQDGKNFAVFYIKEGSFFTCIDCLHDKTGIEKSKYSFDLLSEGKVLSMPFSAFNTIMKLFPMFQIVFNKVLLDYEMQEEQRGIDFRTLNATERFEKFKAEHAEVLALVNLAEIALFLGINVETLSRIRKKLKPSL